MSYEFISSINLLHTILSLIKVISAQKLWFIVVDCSMTSLKFIGKCIGLGYSLVSYIFKKSNLF